MLRLLESGLRECRGSVRSVQLHKEALSQNSFRYSLVASAIAARIFTSSRQHRSREAVSGINAYTLLPRMATNRMLRKREDINNLETVLIAAS